MTTNYVQDYCAPFHLFDKGRELLFLTSFVKSTKTFREGPSFEAS